MAAMQPRRGVSGRLRHERGYWGYSGRCGPVSEGEQLGFANGIICGVSKNCYSSLGSADTRDHSISGSILLASSLWKPSFVCLSARPLHVLARP